MSDSPTLPADLARAVTVRLERLRAALGTHGLDGLIVSHEQDIFYLTGAVGHDALLLVTADRAVYYTDNRYDEQMEPWRHAAMTEVVMGTRHRLPDGVRDHGVATSCGRLGVQADRLTITARAALTATLGDRLTDVSDVVGPLRQLKDDYEVHLIERSIGIQQDGLTAALDQLVVGMSEREFCAVLEFEMRRRGADGTSFSPIIGSGPNSALPHHPTGDTPIEPGVLLIDWGAYRDGYAGDMTRTYGVERMPDKVAEIYEIVLEAQMTAIDACRPGEVFADIDAVARNVITRAGYGEYFGHGLGHGMGIDVHEPPYFNDLQTDVVLQPGHVMTVEPGIYLPGIGGVRIEDDVLITDDGVRVLGNYPKDLASAVISTKSAPSGAAS